MYDPWVAGDTRQKLEMPNTFEDAYIPMTIQITKENISPVSRQRSYIAGVQVYNLNDINLPIS